MAIPFLSGLEIATGTHNEITFTGSGGAKILAPVEMYLDASNDIYLMSHSSVNLTLGNNTATFAGTLSSGTITSTGIVKTSTTFQSTGGSMLFFVPNVGQALEIAQNTGNATFAGTVTGGNGTFTNLTINATEKLRFDGAGGHTYIEEDSNDTLIFATGGTTRLTLDANATFAGDVNTSGDVHIDEGSASSFQTTNKLRFGHTSWNNNVGLESYWMVLGCNQNEGFKFRDSVSNMLLQLQGGNSTSGNGALSATFAGTITAKGQLNIKDSDGSTTLNHARVHSNGTEGFLTLSNGSNWGFIARGPGNDPRIGAWYGGTLRIEGFHSSDGATGSNAIDFAQFQFGNDHFQMNAATSTFAGNVTVTGDFQVNGTTTTVNQTNLDVSDNIIGLNRGSSSNSNDAGLIIERGSTGDNAAMIWDEANDRFVFGLTTSTPSATGSVSITATSDLAARDLDVNNITSGRILATASGTGIHQLVNASTNSTVLQLITTGDNPNLALSFQSDHIYGGSALHIQNDDQHLYLRGSQTTIGTTTPESGYELTVSDGPGSSIYAAGASTFAGNINLNNNNKIIFDKANSSNAGDFDFIEMGYNGSWSTNQGGLAAISVNDGTGVVGKYGITYGTGGGRFVITDLYDGGYGASGDVFSIRGDGQATFAESVILGAPSNGNAVNKLTIASGTNGDGIFLTGLGNANGMGTGHYKAIDFQYSNTDSSFGSAIRFVVTDSTLHGGKIEFWTDNSSGTNTKALTLDKSQNATFTGTVTATHFYGDGSNLTGITASNADTVDSLHAASFLRSDAADTATGQLFFDAGFDSHPIMLSGAQNFDNIDRSGFYNLYNTNSGSTSSPGFSFGTMIAIGNDKGSAGFGLQIAHERLGTGMYVRGMNDTASAWSAWAEIWTSTTDGSGSGLDADTVDGIQGASLLRSDADDSYAGNLTVNGMTFKSDSNVSRNFKIQPSSSTTDVGISAFRGDGNHSFQIYGTNTQYGFLDSNWGGWDIRKTKDGALHIDEGSGLNQVLSLGSDGAGSGLDADTVDGIQGASFLRSDAADTASGNLTFTGNIAQTAGVFLSHGDQTGDANTVWQAAGTGKDRGIYPFRYQANASNIPATNDNANWGLNIYSHGGSGGGYPYGIQLAGANASSGENSLFLRTVSNGSFGSWKRVFHEGHLPTMAEAGVTTATVKALGFLRSNADDTASGVITLSNTSTSATLNLSGHAGASNYNYFLKAANDGGNKVVHFVNGSTRTSDGGANTYTIRNDGGSLRLGSSNYTTLLVGSGDLTYNANEVWHAANDGSGSGLDADTVDGIQASSFLQTGGSWNGANMPGSRYAGLAVNGGEIVFQRDNPNNAQMSILVDGAFYAGENNGFYSLYSGNNYNNKIGFYGNSSGHFYINTTSVKANGNTVWHAGNDGSGTGLDADTLDGLHLSNIDNAESYKTWAVSASGGQAVRHTIGRLYGTPAHWDANWQNIEFQITSEYYEATTLKYRLIGNYNGAGGQANMFQLHLLDAQGDLVNNINLTLGTPTDAGWDYSSQDVYYMDLYADVRYYTQFKIHAKTFAHGHATSNPTSGGYHTIFYASPATANISDFSVNHNDPLFRGNKKWHAGNDGSGTGLDADTVDGIQGSAIITTSNIASQNVNSANKIDGIPFLNTGSNSGVNADTMAQNGHVYYTSGVTNFSGNSTDGGIYAQIYNSDWQHQIAGDYRSGQIAIRGKNNGTWQSWYKVWSENNDGSGSGLDADTLDGSQASAFATLSGSNSFTNSYNEFGNNTGAVSNDGSWNARVNISGTSHARLDLFEDADDSKLRLYVHSNNNARIDTTSSTALDFGTAGTVRMTIPAGSGVVTTTGQGTLWGSGNDGSGTGLDADTLDGYHRTQVGTFQSGSDFADGTLVTTSIVSSNTNGDSFVIEISGKAYGSSRPHKVIAEGYIYNNTIINTNGSNLGGTNFTYLKVMNLNGNLCFWWPRHGYWNSYDVYVRTANTSSGGANHNKVTAIANSTDPSSATKKIQINLGMTWTSHTDGSGSGLDADTVDGLEVHTGTNNAANKIVRTDGNGYANFGWINTVSGNLGTSIPDRIYSSNDGYIRYLDLASFRSVMNVTAKASYQGREQSTSDTNYWIGSLGWGTIDFNTIAHYGSGSIDTWSNPGNQPSGTSHWVGSQHLHYANGSNSWYGQQIVVGAGDPSLMYVRGAWGGTPTSWRKMWNAGNDGSGSTLDADFLDGYDTSQTGGANRVLVTGSNQYLNLNSWINVAGSGLYSSSVNGAHFYPNAGSDYGTWRMSGSRNGWNGIAFNDTSGNANCTLMAETTTMGLYNDADNEWMVEASRNGAVSLYYNGAAKISTGSGGVNVTGTVSASADVIAYSDERLKSNIKTLDGSKVYEMRGVSFTKDDKKGSGVIAQELEKIAPELVNNDSEFKAVAYGNITGYLIEAIKDLKQEVEELKKQIK